MESFPTIASTEKQEYMYERKLGGERKNRFKNAIQQTTRTPMAVQLLTSAPPSTQKQKKTTCYLYIPTHIGEQVLALAFLP